MSVSVVILAAGQGKRMVSDLPKVMHQIGGKSLLEHVVTTAKTVNGKADPIIIYGHDGERVKNALSHLPAKWIAQDEQLGTGHAVLQALPHIDDNEQVLILYGDVPLISENTLKNFIANTPANSIGIITANFPNPFGLGRIIRNNKNEITHIVEEKDADTQTRKISEINSGIYLAPAKYLKKWLPQLTNNNAQQEYYLTDIIKDALKENIQIHDLQPANIREVCGINDRLQLSILEREYQLSHAENFLRQGVTLLDPARFDVRGDLQVGKDTIIDINFIAEGNVKIGDRCKIGANVILKNVTIGNDVEIKPNSIIEGATIANHCVVGPFARVRPDTTLEEKAHIGNFVEIKKSLIGKNTKINHLTYIGDAEVGSDVNIGAGTITCNYDGVNKHKTKIGNNVFVGSDTQFIAPVTIGDNATIGAGSTITKDAPANQLTLSRAVQRSIANWKGPKDK